MGAGDFLSLLTKKILHINNKMNMCHTVTFVKTISKKSQTTPGTHGIINNTSQGTQRYKSSHCIPKIQSGTQDKLRKLPPYFFILANPKHCKFIGRN